MRCRYPRGDAYLYITFIHKCRGAAVLWRTKQKLLWIRLRYLPTYHLPAQSYYYYHHHHYYYVCTNLCLCSAGMTYLVRLPWALSSAGQGMFELFLKPDEHQTAIR